MRTLSESELTQIKAMSHSAHGFLNAYRILSKHNWLASQELLPIEERQYIVPADFVSLAFSVELGLKTLVKFFDERPLKEHKLKEIFYSYLPDECRKDIQSALLAAKNPYPDDLLEQMLEANNNAFVKWRYNYEGSQLQINPHFLNVFADAVLSVVSKYYAQSKEQLQKQDTPSQA